jgi:ketosteroid isomerase-like protein
MSDIATWDAQLNQMILEGKAMEAFERFYADDVVMQENSDEPFQGKDTNRQRELDFFSKVEQVHELKTGATAASGDVSFSEWDYDITFKGGSRIRWSQVAVRRWKDGKVVHERFYYKPAY